MMPIIDMKWEKIYKYLFIHFLLYFFLMLFANIGTLKEKDYKVFLSLALPFNLLLIIVELMTLKIARQKYFTLYNCFDVCILTYTLTLLFLNLFIAHASKMSICNFILLLLINVRFILELRFI